MPSGAATEVPCHIQGRPGERLGPWETCTHHSGPSPLCCAVCTMASPPSTVLLCLVGFSGDGKHKGGQGRKGDIPG